MTPLKFWCGHVVLKSNTKYLIYQCVGVHRVPRNCSETLLLFIQLQVSRTVLRPYVFTATFEGIAKARLQL